MDENSGVRDSIEAWTHKPYDSALESFTGIERYRLDEVGKRFDPDQDGYSIGAEASEDVLYAANFVIANPHNTFSKDYIARIQARDLLSGG